MRVLRHIVRVLRHILCTSIGCAVGFFAIQALAPFWFFLCMSMGWWIQVRAEIRPCPGYEWTFVLGETLALLLIASGGFLGYRFSQSKDPDENLPRA